MVTMVVGAEYDERAFGALREVPAELGARPQSDAWLLGGAYRSAMGRRSLGLLLLLSVALLACRKAHPSAGGDVDPSRGGFYVHKVDDESHVLDPPEPCPGIELMSERVRSSDVPVRFLVSEDASTEARKKLEDCLQRQAVPPGKAFAVGPTGKGFRSYLIRVEPSIEPADCKRVSVNPREEGGPPSVLIQLTPAGSRKLADLTRAMVRQRMALVVGDMVYAAPIVWTEITGGSATVTLGPNRNDDDANALANTIAEGSPALPKPGVRTFGRSVE